MTIEEQSLAEALRDTFGLPAGVLGGQSQAFINHQRDIDDYIRDTARVLDIRTRLDILSGRRRRGEMTTAAFDTAVAMVWEWTGTLDELVDAAVELAA